MINFDSLTLRLFYIENSGFFTGARIQKIQQPSKYELIFNIRSKNMSKKLYINFHPNFAHICFLTPKTETLRCIVIPQKPPMFSMLLRKYIQNAKITRVNVPDYERIFEIYFEYYNELNEKSELCLAVELTGRCSNVILYSYDTNVIIGCAHNISAEKGSDRELRGSLPYVYPVKQHKKDLLNTGLDTFIQLMEHSFGEKEDIPRAVSSLFYYLTIPLVSDAAETIIPFDLKKLYEKLKIILTSHTPCIKNDYSKYYTSDFSDTFKCADINTMIDKYFSYHQHQYIVNQLKRKINSILQSRLKKLYTLKERQQEQLKKLDEASEYKKKADIIQANLYALKQGASLAELQDFDGGKITIALDENKSPAENAAKYYRLYKKAKTAYEYSAEMVKETNSEILYFEEISYFCLNTDSASDLNSLFEEVIKAQPDNKKVSETARHDEERTAENIVSFEIDGYKIYAGRNKKQNDYILSKLSAPDDLWFHPLNAAGAHIIVKTDKSEGGGIVPDSVILKAAETAKEYSSQKNNSKTSIIYTKRRYVKKASGKQAFVTYKNEKEIIV